MAIRTASTYAEIVKFEEQKDGTVIAYGKATDATLDSDEQICDPAWLKQAMPEWFKYGNIREQHSSIAAGVATEYEEKDGGHYITAHIVDPSSAKKVKTGVLKGFSIGIRRPRVIKDNKAAGGRIVDGEIVEVSIVDRPANPSCTLVVAKAVGGVMTQVEEYTEKGSPDQPRDDHGRFASDGSSGESENRVQGGNRGELAHGGLTDKVGELANSASTDESRMLAQEAADLMQRAAAEEDDEKHLDLTYSAADKLFEASGYETTRAGKEAMRNTSDEIENYVSTYSKSVRPALIKGSPDQPRDENGRFASSDGGSEVSVNDTHNMGNATTTVRAGQVLQRQKEDIAKDLAHLESVHGHVVGVSEDRLANAQNAVATANTHLDNAAQAISQANTETAVSELRAAYGALQGESHFGPTAANISDLATHLESKPLWEPDPNSEHPERVADTHSGLKIGDKVSFSDPFSPSGVGQATVRGFGAIMANGTVVSIQRDGETHTGSMQSDDLTRQNKSANTDSEQSIKSTNGNLVKDISSRVNKYAATDIKKFDQGSFDTARRALATLIQVEAGEMADGHDETYSLSCLLQAVHSLMCWYEGEEAEGETVEMPEGIEMSDKPATVKAEDGVCETCGEKECKCSSKADEVEDSACKECGEKECKCAEGGYRATEKSANTEDDLRATITDIVKSLLPTEVGEVDATKAAESERIEVLEAELARVKSLAAPNGPRRFGAVSSTSKEQLNKAKARQLRAKAEMTLDKALADGYRQMARDLETNSETE